MKKLLNNVTKSYISTLIGLGIVLLDIFFFFWGELGCATFITILIIGLGLFLLPEEDILKWIKNKLNS